MCGNLNSVFVLVLNTDHKTNLHADTSVQFVFFWCTKAVLQLVICLY